MKKCIAVLLTIIMAFSFASVAFAADKVTIPDSVGTLQYDTNYAVAEKATKWYSVKAVSKYLMLVAVGKTGDTISLNVYKADGTAVVVDTQVGKEGSVWSDVRVYILTAGETYYIKADFNGAYFYASNCWIDYGKYNSYSRKTLDDIKLVSNDVTKNFSGSDNTLWDVYEVSDDFIWSEDYLDENVGCYFTSVKLASNTPVYFENNCKTNGVPSIYKGLYTEVSTTGDELGTNESAYYAVSYDVLHTEERVAGTASRGSVLIYVPAGSKLTAKDNVVHVKAKGISIDTDISGLVDLGDLSGLSGLSGVFADFITYFHSFLPLIWKHIVTLVNAIVGLF